MRRYLIISLFLPVLALWASPAAADQTIGGACTSSTADGAQGANGNNVVCINSLWQYPAYQFGASSATCNSGNAGIVRYSATNLQYCNATSFTTLAAAGTVALSALTAANAADSFDSGNWAQTWNWNALTGAGIAGIQLYSSSTAAASNAQTLLNISMSGANATSTQTTYGEKISNTNSGTNESNVALYAEAYGGTNNYAAIFNSGYVGVGTATPAATLDIAGGTADGMHITVSNGSPYGILLYNTTFNASAGNGLGFWQDTSGNDVIDNNGATAIYIDTGNNMFFGKYQAPINKATVLGSGTGVVQIGTAGCGNNYVGLTLGQTSQASGCSNYNLLSSPTDQQLFINRPAGQGMYFQEATAGPAQLALLTGGNVGIGNETGTGLLAVGSDLYVVPDSATVQVISGALRDSGGWVYIDSVGSITLNFDTASSNSGSFTFNTGSAVKNLLKVTWDGNLALTTTGTYLNWGATANVGNAGYGFHDSAGTMQVKNSGGSWATIAVVSDQRVKRDIVDLPEDEGLAAIMKLRPVLFHWKDVQKDRDEGEQMGLIAQDVEKAFPSGGITYNFGNVTMTLPDGKKETVEHARGMNYERLVAPLIKAVQEQKEEIDKQDGEFADLQNEITDLKEAGTRH